MNVKLISIDKIGLSARSRNALHRAEVHLVGDMLKHTEESLLEIKNLGKKSIDEILQKIEHYRKMDAGIEEHEDLPDDFDPMTDEHEYSHFICEYLQKRKTFVDELELLPARAYNLLMLGDCRELADVLFLEEEDLLQRFPHMDQQSAREVRRACRYFIVKHESEFQDEYKKRENASVEVRLSVFDLLSLPEYQEQILKFVQVNDQPFGQTEMPEKIIRKLLQNGFTRMSEIITKSRAELLQLPKISAVSANEIEKAIRTYLTENEARILAVLSGDKSALWNDDAIISHILDLYRGAAFKGFSFQEFKEKLQLEDQVTDDRLKKLIGSLLKNHHLEYVDYRCYRIYEKFEDYLKKVATDQDRDNKIVWLRLHGKTLEEIGTTYDLSRERVRQIIHKTVDNLHKQYSIATGKEWFDEDYYRYFYATYDFEKKDAEEWLGIDRSVFMYLEMRDVKQGKKNLSLALEDVQNLDVGLRLKIKNYLNRNKVYVDGIWVEKRRADLEDIVLRKFCTEDICYKDFPAIYNRFLEDMEIPYDEKIYFTDAVYRTRSNRLKESHSLLWKYGEMLRAYDVDGRDYTELFETLNLDSYENIELSTLKFMEEYPEILARYDIRDQYELHDLLRKVLPDGSFHNFKCERMPHILFGEFSRDAAIFDLLVDNAPISAVDLADLIRHEYGYTQEVILSTYLQPFTKYYYNGMYDVDQKKMSEEHRKLLKEALTEDFYYFNDIRKTYARILPGADLEEINPYNLKLMGFVVLSNYAVQNYPSLEAYCEDILTRDDIVDISQYRSRLVYVQMFSQKLMELKRNLDVIEFEPNQIMNFRRLQAAGISKDMIQDFCDEVYEFVEENSYFSAKSIRKASFISDLYDLGFSDWFYANLLLSDDRFSFGYMYKTMILYKGKKNITIKSFESSLVKKAGSMDAFDLVTELTDVYGCQPDDKSDVLYKLNGSEIYYDKILDRLYANSDLYYQELDETEGI